MAFLNSETSLNLRHVFCYIVYKDTRTVMSSLSVLLFYTYSVSFLTDFSPTRKGQVTYIGQKITFFYSHVYKRNKISPFTQKKTKTTFHFGFVPIKIWILFTKLSNILDLPFFSDYFSFFASPIKQGLRKYILDLCFDCCGFFLLKENVFSLEFIEQVNIFLFLVCCGCDWKILMYPDCTLCHISESIVRKMLLEQESLSWHS